MNFLAHCLIGARAGTGDAAPALIAGGFLGDFIKGRVPARMPQELARGVRLHRRVDAYSNQHPEIRASCERFPAELRRIAPILVDIICDHLLARRWEDFHQQPITAFTRETYRLVGSHGEWLGDSGHRFLSYARDKDLLAVYHDWSVASSAMRSITRRLSMSELDPLMDDATPGLLQDLEQDFLNYFPDIIKHASDWVAADSNPTTFSAPG